MDEQTVSTTETTEMESAFDSGWDNDNSVPETGAAEDTTAEETDAAEESTDEANQQEQEETEVTDKAAETKPEAADEFDLNYMGNHEKVGRNEVIALAQKGKDYDRIRGKLDEASNELKTLREQKGSFDKYQSFLERVAKRSNTDIDTLMTDIEANMMVDEEAAKGNKISKDAALERIKFNRYKAETEAKANKEADSKAEEKAEPTDTAKARMDDEVAAFIREYPDVKATDIPQSVWEEVKGGKSLVGAYARYENKQLRTELNTIKQNQKNSARSTGSRNTAGTGKQKDAFDLGWDY